MDLLRTHSLLARVRTLARLVRGGTFSLTNLVLDGLPFSTSNEAMPEQDTADEISQAI